MLDNHTTKIGDTLENYTFSRTIELDSELIEEIIETAGYGIAYWAHTAHHDSLAETYTLTWDGDDFADENPNSAGEHKLDYPDIAKAVESIYNGNIQINEGLLNQLEEWVNGHPTMDVDLADVVIQVALFDEIIYG